MSFHFRAHDLRRTAASYMGEAGVDRFHIAHVLNHRSVTQNTVTAIYDRYRYDKEKRAALGEVGRGAVRDRGRQAGADEGAARRAPRQNVYEFSPQSRRRSRDERALRAVVWLLRILRTDLRVMRKPAVLAALFPTVRVMCWRPR